MVGWVILGVGVTDEHLQDAGVLDFHAELEALHALLLGEGVAGVFDDFGCWVVGVAYFAAGE